MRWARFFSFVLLPFVQGCSIHPLQQDVTGIPTAALSDHIRCEARDAVEKKAIELLEAYRIDGAGELAEQFRLNPLLFATFKRSQLRDDKEKAFYDKYIKTAIAFNFTFDITEDDKATAQVDLLKPFSGGSFSLGVGFNGDLNRENQRRFVVSDTFEELLTNKTLSCDFAPHDNYAYPMSGSIGLAELISTFIDMNEDKQLEFIDKTEVFADTLTFITTIGASANPKVTFVPTGRSFQVADAPLTGAVSRIDKHSVIVGLSLGGKEDHANKGTATPLSSSIIPGSAILASNTGTATERAILATISQRFNTFLDRFGL